MSALTSVTGEHAAQAVEEQQALADERGTSGSPDERGANPSHSSGQEPRRRGATQRAWR
jgi:hypothetical protein